MKFLFLFTICVAFISGCGEESSKKTDEYNTIDLWEYVVSSDNREAIIDRYVYDMNNIEQSVTISYSSIKYTKIDENTSIVSGYTQDSNYERIYRKVENSIYIDDIYIDRFITINSKDDDRCYSSINFDLLTIICDYGFTESQITYKRYFGFYRSKYTDYNSTEVLISQ